MTPWRLIFRKFAEHYYWRPEDVLALTMRQVRLYWEDEEFSGTKRNVKSRKDAEDLKMRLQKQKQGLVDYLKTAIRVV